MTQNKTTPLSEKAVSIGDIDYEDNSVSKRFFRKEDVRDAVRRLMFWEKNYNNDRIFRQICGEIFGEIFGEELCNSQQEKSRNGLDTACLGLNKTNPADTHNHSEEVCKNCGKTKDKHYEIYHFCDGDYSLRGGLDYARKFEPKEKQEDLKDDN